MISPPTARPRGHAIVASLPADHEAQHRRQEEAARRGVAAYRPIALPDSMSAVAGRALVSADDDVIRRAGRLAARRGVLTVPRHPHRSTQHV